MTESEYNEAMRLIDYEFNLRKKELYKQFAYSNNPYKAGDIITDHIGSIRIETIKVYKNSDRPPMCVYNGVELKKDMTPKSKLPKRDVYQQNLTEV